MAISGGRIFLFDSYVLRLLRCHSNIANFELPCAVSGLRVGEGAPASGAGTYAPQATCVHRIVLANSTSSVCRTHHRLPSMTMSLHVCAHARLLILGAHTSVPGAFLIVGLQIYFAVFSWEYQL